MKWKATGIVGTTLTALAIASQAAPLFETDMGMNSVTGVTASVLDNVSTGGSWAVDFINITTTNIVASTNGTDYALLVDESTMAGSSTGTHVTVTLDSDVDYNTSPVLVEFDMGAARGGSPKILTVTGYGEDDATIAFQIFMDVNNYLYQGLTDSGVQTVATDYSMYAAPNAYNPSLLRGFSVMLDGSTLIYGTEDTRSLGTTNLNAQTKLSSIKWEISGNTANAQGFWLDNINVEATDGNLAPFADDLEATVVEDDSVEITLSGSDPEGSNLTYNVSQPANGTVTTNGALPNVIYTPDADFAGTDSFTYTVNDGEYSSAPATVTVTVEEGDDDAPVADDLEVSVSINSTVEITLSGSDPEGGNLTYSVASGPTNGNLNATSGQVLTYTPNTDYVGPDSFTYTVNDGTQDSALATVSITVNDVFDGGLLLNGDFEINGGNLGGGKTTTFESWQNGGTLRNDLASETGKVPGETGNVVIRLAKNSTMYQYFSTSWDAKSTFNISLNACEASWKVGAVGNGITVSLRSAADNTINVSTLIDLDGTHDNVSRYETWAANQTHNLVFSGAELIAAGLTAGEDLRFNIYSKNNNNSINWIDNTSVMVGSDAPPVEVGDISIEIVSDGTEVALSWPTKDGWDYGVKTCNNLTIGDWSTILIDGVPGTGGEVTITNPVSTSPAFYRAYLDNE